MAQDMALMPPWLWTFATARFLNECTAHHGKKFNDARYLCPDCNAIFCKHCRHEQTHRPPIRIRKYLKNVNAVVRVTDMESMRIDCSSIEKFVGDEKQYVVFVKGQNTEARNRNTERHRGSCTNCQCRMIDDPAYVFCSLMCKVENLRLLHRLADILLPEPAADADAAVAGGQGAGRADDTVAAGLAAAGAVAVPGGEGAGHGVDAVAAGLPLPEQFQFLEGRALGTGSMLLLLGLPLPEQLQFLEGRALGTGSMLLLLGLPLIQFLESRARDTRQMLVLAGQEPTQV